MLLNSSCYNLKVTGAVITAIIFLSFGSHKCTSLDWTCKNNQTAFKKFNGASDATGGLEAHRVSCSTNALLSEFKLDFPEMKRHRYIYKCCQGKTSSCTTNNTKTFSNRIDLSKMAHLHVSCPEESALSQFRLQKQSKNSDVDVYYSFTCCKVAPALINTECRRVSSTAIDNSLKKAGPAFTLEYLSDMAVSCSGTEVLNNFAIVQSGKLFKYSFRCCETLPFESPWDYMNYMTIAIISSFLLLTGTIVWTVITCCRRCSRASIGQENQENKNNRTNKSIAASSESHPLITISSLPTNGANNSAVPVLLTNEQLRNMNLSAVTKINQSQLKIDDDGYLGSGAFGVVEKGKLTPRTSWQVPDNSSIIVAVKKTLPRTNQEGKIQEKEAKERELLEDEAKLLALIGNHKNVVCCYGIISENGIFNMVLEYCDGGDLKHYLDRLQQNYLGGADENPMMRKLVDLAGQVADGMAFVHSKRCVHRDLAARNILLTNNYSTAKITDFGLAKDIYKNGFYKGDPKRKRNTPWAWTAPEFLRNLEYNPQSDVWSFGVLLWEMLTLGQHPYINENCDTDFVNRLQKGLLRLDKPELADDELYNVMLDCWQIVQINRPDFITLGKRLTDYLNTSDDNSAQQKSHPATMAQCPNRATTTRPDYNNLIARG